MTKPKPTTFLGEVSKIIATVTDIKADVETLRNERDQLKEEVATLRQQLEVIQEELNTTNDQFNEHMALDNKLITDLNKQLADISNNADRNRIEYLEDKAKSSRTGVTIDYCKHSENGYVLEKGFRICYFHNLSARFKTLAEAIDAAMQKDQSNET